MSDFTPFALSSKNKSLVKPEDSMESFKLWGQRAKKNISSLLEPDSNSIERGSLLPLVKDKRTGEVSLGLPSIVKDSLVGLGVYDKALKGEIDIESPEAREAAVNMAFGTSLGSLSMSRLFEKELGSGVLGTMIGKGSQLFDTDMAINAQQLAQQGVDARDIWSQTGTRRWASGDRQEISDDLSKILPAKTWIPKATFLHNGEKVDYNKAKELTQAGEYGNMLTKMKLEDVLDHETLYKAYPDLKGLQVVIDPKLKGKNAWYDPSKDEIGVSGYSISNNDRGTFLHEIQHAIQTREGWQNGGNPEMFERIKDLLPIKNDEGQFRIYSNYEKYQGLPGEMESRQTTDRIDLTPEERLRFFPDDAFFPSSGYMKIHTKEYGVKK